MPDKQAVTVGPGTVGRKRALEIRSFILDQLNADEFRDVVTAAREAFPVSRQVIHKQIKRLEAKGLIEGKGLTKRRVHRLDATKSRLRRKVEGLQEYGLWREFAEPRLRDLGSNVLDICHFGFTEMVNNVIDHSESEEIIVSIERNAKSVRLLVIDHGIGIFRKIRDAMELPSLQEALFELTKGKFTTDPSKHSGEGIFYTTRMFD